MPTEKLKTGESYQPLVVFGNMTLNAASDPTVDNGTGFTATQTATGKVKILFDQSYESLLGIQVSIGQSGFSGVGVSVGAILTDGNGDIEGCRVLLSVEDVNGNLVLDNLSGKKLYFMATLEPL